MDHQLPLKLTIDLCYTITPNEFYILKNAHIPMADDHPSIDHRSMLYHYTHEVSHIEKCTYTHGRQMLYPQFQSMIDLCYTITPNKFHL